MTKKNNHNGSNFEDFLKSENIDVDLIKKIRQQEKEKAYKAVMDLYFALKEIKGSPSLRDLVKLAKRIKNSDKTKKISF